jgi:tRNA G18 (ribose-2'-O)-methylase SpoU
MYSSVVLTFCAKSRPTRLIALTPEEGSASIRSVQSTGGPSALLLGAEGPGLARRTLGLADLRVRVPMNPEADSLNVATTAALALHELMSHG